ncbi:MAG: 3-oxoacyl-[acyl-carrier protein] reductase, partial [Candidatus Binatota bacterium]|nr:3-oxoacyl-[acyl-carrier protein] reductase [Candidatus Binatota bacterium]
MRLEGKVALVTGGGSGIGREICIAFAREGASVAVNDVNREGIDGTIRAMGEGGARAMPAPADVSDAVAVARAVEELVRRYGTLDVLVNNAGIGEVSGQSETDRMNRVAEAQMGEMLSGGPIRTFWEVTQAMEDAVWDRMLRVHLYGTFHCTREALKVMEKKGYGRIVNISSIAATVGLEGAPHYSAAKAGILGFTRSVAREVGARGITVNAIAPGLIDTPMTDPLSPLVRQAWMMNTPLKKSGKPKDIAAAALYLASDDGEFVTGQI